MILNYSKTCIEWYSYNDLDADDLITEACTSMVENLLRMIYKLRNSSNDCIRELQAKKNVKRETLF